ncbi:MBL fold metallo-hydrolase [Hyphobacterium sp.]|uniref:MBL fold metallo-hydrolase n=1 Tax=Hyphobacterium sp. TaxID=2004662 RepID=UPI003BAD3B08
MSFQAGKSYFIAQPSVHIRATASAKAKSLNHLIFGDWVRCLESESGGWVKIYSRRKSGFVREDELTQNRALEVNFLDIGQGDSAHIVTPDDQVMIIDGGMTNNLYRFLAWRYNLRQRDENTAPFDIDYVVISHPDKDHYYGLRHVFAEPKLSIKTVLHNGIFEKKDAPGEKAADKAAGFAWSSDLGRAYRPKRGTTYLLDLVRTTTDMRRVVAQQAGLNSAKNYFQTFDALRDNPSNAGCTYRMIDASDGFLDGFEDGKPLSIEILGPVTEEVEIDGKTHTVLRTLGKESETKNGHSVIFRFKIGAIRILLGGDLNTASEDYLLRHYTGIQEDASDLDKAIYKLERKGSSATPDEIRELDASRAARDHIVAVARSRFEVDVAKACHHGSHHFSETFLKALNAIATVISSGDEESYGHPRPDALGAFGKCGRGHRPLIFSTEIARSTREFTPIKAYFDKLRDYEAKIAAAEDAAEKKRLTEWMEGAKDSNVARYGMVTLRTDGTTTIIATKLEVPNGDTKWDIHQLEINADTGQVEYRDKTKEH